MRPYEIKNNIELGKEIFQNIPCDIVPGWAGLILSRFDGYLKDIPMAVRELNSITEGQDKWKQAHSQFDKIRRFLLDNKNYQPETYLLLAENVAKVTYNASNEPAPFDNDSGWYIPRLALEAAFHFEDSRLEDEVLSTILIFNRNKHLKSNLSAAADFFIYKKIDDILWFNWDPLGVNDLAPRDEYQSYVPGIYNLKKTTGDRNIVANALWRIQIDAMGAIGKTLEECLVIADKIVAI